jgi:hypothetical protein
MIYNTFVPIAGKSPSDLRLDDFETAREDLIAELRQAPTRRLDNQITQLAGFAERLRLHAGVINEAARRYRSLRFRAILGLGLVGLTAAAIAVAVGVVIALPAIAGGLALAALVLRFSTLPRAQKRLIAGFDDIFASLHDHELLMRDRAEDLHAVSAEIRARTREVAEKRGLGAFRKMDAPARAALDALIETEIPAQCSALFDVLQASPPASPAGTGQSLLPKTLAAKLRAAQ